MSDRELCDTCSRELPFRGAVSVTDRGTYCYPCYNAWVAEERGIRFDNTEFEPVSLTDPTGVSHTFRIQSRLAAGIGHVLEAIELDMDGYGYHLEVMGPEESDAMALFQELFARMREAVGHRHLKDGSHGLEFAGDDRLQGRIEMDSETGLPVLVVDGRPRSWDEIGRLVLSYEGWNVAIEIRDSIEQLPDPPEPGMAQPSGDAPH